MNNPVIQGTSQIQEFAGMMKQQQQVLELQKEMKQLRETRRISAEGLQVNASAGDLETAYQAKVVELQKTLQSLLQQRQQLGTSPEVMMGLLNVTIILFRVIIEGLHEAVCTHTHDFALPLGFLFVWRGKEKNSNRCLNFLFTS